MKILFFTNKFYTHKITLKTHHTISTKHHAILIGDVQSHIATCRVSHIGTDTTLKTCLRFNSHSLFNTAMPIL